MCIYDHFCKSVGKQAFILNTKLLLCTMPCETIGFMHLLMCLNFAYLRKLVWVVLVIHVSKLQYFILCLLNSIYHLYHVLLVYWRKNFVNDLLAELFYWISIQTFIWLYGMAFMNTTIIRTFKNWIYVVLIVINL